MLSLCTFSIAAAAANFGVAGYAQTLVDHAARHPGTATSFASGAMPMGGSGGPMAHMNGHMQAHGQKVDEMAMQHRMMEKRLEMVQIMMDRMPPSPAKS